MKDTYEKTNVDHLKKELGIKNKLATPKLVKININVGIGSYIRSGSKDFDSVIENITNLTGQRPTVKNARISVSNFKLREGQPVGITTTIRGNRMYDFVNRLVNIVFPRMRDFRGISVKGFDGNGNYSFGVKEVTVFPEVNPDNVSRNHGLQFTIVTSAKTDLEGYLLLKAMGFPFRDQLTTNN